MSGLTDKFNSIENLGSNAESIGEINARLENLQRQKEAIEQDFESVITEIRQYRSNAAHGNSPTEGEVNDCENRFQQILMALNNISGEQTQIIQKLDNTVKTLETNFEGKLSKIPNQIRSAVKEIPGITRASFGRGLRMRAKQMGVRTTSTRKGKRVSKTNAQLMSDIRKKWRVGMGNDPYNPYGDTRPVRPNKVYTGFRTHGYETCPWSGPYFIE